MKAIKITLWILMLLVVLAVAAVVIVTKTIDPNDYKAQIEKLVEDKTGRNLSLLGTLELTFFPWIGVETGKVELASARGFGKEPMVAVDNARIKVKLMPLVRREVEVDTVVLDAPVVRVSTNAQGVNSWDDLLGEKAADEKEPGSEAGAVAALAVQGVSINGGSFLWQNDQSGQSLSLSEVNLETGKLVPGDPLDVTLSLDAAGSLLPAPASASIDTTVTVGPKLDRITLDGTKLDIKTTDQENKTLEASLSAGQVRYGLAAQTLALTGLDGTLNRDGNKARIELKSLDANLEKMLIDLPGVTVTQGDDRIKLRIKGEGVDAASRKMDGDFELLIADLRALLTRFGLESVLSDIPDTALTNIRGGAAFQVAGNQLNAQNLAVDAEVNGLPTAIKIPALDFNLDNEALALPDLSATQQDFILKLSVNGKGLLTPGEGRAANGAIDLQVADVAKLLARNGIKAALPEIPVSEVNLQTNFALAGDTLTTSRLATEFNYQGQSTAVAANRASFNIENGALELEAFKLTQGEFSAQATATGSNTLAGLDKMALAGSLSAVAPDVPGLLSRNAVEVELPAGLVTSARLDGDFNLRNNSLGVSNLKAEVDDMKVSGSLSVNNLTAPGYQFDLDINKLDVDRLTAGQASEGSPQPSTAEQILLPVAPLQGLNVDGRARIGELITTGLTLTRVDLTVKADENVLRVAPLKANVFGGSLDSSLRYDVSGKVPSIQMQNKINNVAVGDLLTALEITDKIDGTGNLTTDLRGQGADVDQIIASIAGDIGFRILDGAIRGYDLQAALIEIERQVVALQGGESSNIAQPEAETKFAELSGTLQANKGVFRNNDLEMKAPLFRVSGGGEIGLPNNRIDYKLNVNVVKSVEGQGGASLDQLENARIPLKIYGPLSAPSITLDLASLVKEQAKKEIKRQLLKEFLPEALEQESPEATGNAPSVDQGQQSPEQAPKKPESLEDTLKKELKKGLLKGLGF